MPSTMPIPVLSVSLLLSWGSLYYAFAILAEPMQQELRYGAGTLAGAFSVALLVWGLATYLVGLAMDRWGARRVMTLGSLIAAAGFLGLHTVSSLWSFYILWSLLGLAMAMTLYEPAFALVVQHFPDHSKRHIGWLTIVGGLASTVFWPLSAYLNTRFGWRDTMLVFAAMHLLISVLLHSIRLPQERRPLDSKANHKRDASLTRSKSAHQTAFAQLSLCFAIYGFITATMTVQVIPILESRGFNSTTALSLAACIGPMQVLGRAIDLLFDGRLATRRMGITTLTLMSLSLAALWLAQWLSALCIVFVVTYGLGLGLLTVVRATAPLALSGASRYASNSAVLGAPALVARAAGPIGAALLFEAFGDHSHVLIVLLVSSGLGSLLYLRAWPRTAEVA